MPLSAKILPLSAALVAAIAVTGCSQQETVDTETDATTTTATEGTTDSSHPVETNPTTDSADLTEAAVDNSSEAKIEASAMNSVEQASETEHQNVSTETKATSSTNTNEVATDAGLLDSSQAATIDNSQPSLMTNPAVKPGSPEATVKKALDTLYYGDAKDAARYYKVDMKNFSDELAKTQFAFQQTVEGVTITNTTYNNDKTQATIEGELMLKGQKDPAPLTYELQKVDGKWKILG